MFNSIRNRLFFILCSVFFVLYAYILKRPAIYVKKMWHGHLDRV